MRWTVAIGMGLALASGCAIGVGDDRGGVPYVSGDPVGDELPDEDEDRSDESSSSDEGGGSASATGPMPPPTTGGSSSDDGDDPPDASTGLPEDDTTTSGVPEDDDTSTGGGEGDPGTLPDDGPWSACAGPSCGAGYLCIAEHEDASGMCTVPCVAPGDASACPAAPGDVVAPICITVQGLSLCALDCSGGRECPGGSSCVADQDDAGPVEVCL